MRVTFRAKLMAVVAINALALIAIALTSAFTARQVDERLRDVQDNYLPRLGLGPRLEAQFERLQRGFQDSVAADDGDLLEGTAEQYAELRQLVTSAGAAIDPERRAPLDGALEAYYAAGRNVSSRLIAGETGESLVEAMEAMTDKQQRAAALLEQATAFDQSKLAGAFEAVAAAQRTADRIRLIVSAICLIAVIVASLWISRGVLYNLAHLTAGLRRFGDGDFSQVIPTGSQDEIADVAVHANQMAGSLDRLSGERDRTNWLKEGEAGLAQELRGELEPSEVADRALAFLCRHLGASVGALYWADAGDALELLGRYAATGEADGGPAPRFRIGEGIVGQAALHPEISIIEGDAANALRIRSGLAEGAARAIVLVPLLRVGKVSGVVELAMLGPWAERSSALLLAVRDTLAIAIEVAHGRDATRRLLAETQHQAERLRSQEETLRTVNQGLETKAEELAAASAYKSQFLANMSHELRTPLNAILGFAELLHDGAVPPDAPEHNEFLGDILNSGRHLLQLINDVLDLSKVEAGKLEFSPELIHPSQLVAEVLAILRTTAAARRINIEASIDPRVGEVVLDPGRLKQVLYNYLSNAIKFSPEAGTVAIRILREDPASFRLEVEDSGVGISAEDQGRLFIEFQQIRGSGQKRQGGTGLGLALTRRLVEAQGGTVGVVSTRGKGSVFHAVLPRIATGKTAPARPRAVPGRAGAPSVLVIEDDPSDQRQLVDALSGAGYAVEVAPSGTEAIARCGERSFDAITLDLLLPDMSGLDVMRQIRGGANADAPVLVITVVAEPGAVAGFAVQDVLSKPVDDRVLLSALERAGVPPSKGTVLLVDDDPGSLRLMEATLKKLGYATHCERDGESALRAARGEPPSAVVLDLMMPGMNGFEFLDHLRSDPAGKRVPVIVWTVKDLTAEETATLRASAQAVVAKGHGGSAAVVAELRTFVAAPGAS